MSKEFYLINSKSLATVINYLTGERYYTYDDKLNEGQKIYSFKNTEKLKQALTKIKELKKDFN
jgi:succinate dehydrogenase/fumarate reductase flavoprotein subunit